MIAVLALSALTNAAPVTIWEDGAEWFKIAHKNPSGDEDVRVRLLSKLDQRLGSLDTATTICFRTEDDTYTVEAGSAGFAVQWWCGITDCRWNYQLGAVFFPSTAKSASPVTWGTPEAGTDLSHLNKGVGKTRGGKRPDYLYGMSTAEFESSNLPGEGEEVFLKCYINNEGTYYETNLNTDLELESSDPEEVSDWNVQTIHLNAPEEPEETEAEDSGESTDEGSDEDTSTDSP
jgi:hypothetical protein